MPFLISSARYSGDLLMLAVLAKSLPVPGRGPFGVRSSVFRHDGHEKRAGTHYMRSHLYRLFYKIRPEQCRGPAAVRVCGCGFDLSGSIVIRHRRFDNDLGDPGFVDFSGGHGTGAG